MFVTGYPCAISFSFPCMNKIATPIGPIPLPLFNISLSCASAPNVPNIFTGGLLSQNLLTPTFFSMGSEVSAPLGGLFSQMFCSFSRNVLGSFICFQSCAPAKRFLDPTTQNGYIPNSWGITLTMAMFKWMIMR
jgi:hypothetical protein